VTDEKTKEKENRKQKVRFLLFSFSYLGFCICRLLPNGFFHWGEKSVTRRLFWMKRNQKRRHGDLSFGDPDPGTRDSLGVVEGEDRVFWEKKIEDGLRPLDYPRFYFLSPKDKRLQIKKMMALRTAGFFSSFYYWLSSPLNPLKKGIKEWG